MKRRIVISVITLCSCLLMGQDIDIADLGARSGGQELNTNIIQLAIDSLFEQGGGRVIIPEGRFLTGSIILRSNVNLHLDNGALLLGSTNPDDYFKLNTLKSLILSDGQENISITGRGEINGQGRALALHVDSLFHAGQIDSSLYNFVEKRPRYYLRPHVVEFVNCKDVNIAGVTLRDAAFWVCTLDRCVDVEVTDVFIDSDAYWNNDGIDIVDSKNVTLSNCNINASDDGICLKSHRKSGACENILIENCTVRSSASAVKIGTKSLGGFRDIIIRDIRVYDTFRSAIAIESVDGGFLENVVVDGIKATNTGNAIFVRLGQRENGKASTLTGVVLRNIEAEIAFERPDYAYDVRGPALPFFHNTFPASITGLPGQEIDGIVLQNISIRYPGRGNKALAYAPLSRLKDIPECIGDYPEFSMFGELPAWGLYIRHVRNIEIENLRISVAEHDYRPALVMDDVTGLTGEAISVAGDDKSAWVVLHRCSEVHTGIDTDRVILMD